MSEMFLAVLNNSISAIWMVLGVMAARLLLKRAPRWMVCALWALVALRLVFGGIQAPFSLIPSSELIPPQSLFDQAPVIHSGLPLVDNIVNPVYTESLRPTPGASINPLQVWLAFFANIWLLGMGVMGAWAAISCLRLRRQVRESVAAGDVYLCDRIGSPFIFGLFRPRIYLPSGLDEDSRRHVIAHEKAHLARRDHWWKPLGFALLTVNWFNPVMWLAYVLLCRDIELACDEKVVQTFTAAEKKAYSTALLRCSVNPRSISACPLAFGEVGVKQRVKSVLHYRKPAFWVILAAIVLAVALAAGLLTDPLGRSSEILYNGCLYELFNPEYSFVPAQEPVAALRSILHNTDAHPTEELQATNLDESLAGCPLYLEGENLYLVKFDGSCLAFRTVQPRSFLAQAVETELDFVICAGGAHVDEWESLPEDRSVELRQLMKELLTESFEPVRESAVPDGSFSIYLYPDSLTCLMDLTLGEDGFWYLHFYEEEAGANQNWKLRCDALTEWAAPYLDRTAYYDSIYAESDAVIVYQTFVNDALALNVGLPQGWQAEELTLNDNAAGFRFQPEGRTGWIHVNLFPEEARLDIQTNTPSPAEFPGGITGTIYSLYADQWEILRLDTTCGTLLLRMSRDVDWWADFGSVAEAIIGSIRAYDNGDMILGKPNQLGITMEITNVTASGGTLVCTQDGTLWDSIITGAPWDLQRFENGQWVSIMPESTVWTSIAYVVQPGENLWNVNWGQIIGSLELGHYRISKTFWGERTPMFTLGLEKETVQQTCYAEFIIE